jgi:adenine-specific DNA-methyltransferase
MGNYLAITGQVDEEGKRINTNSESDGRYHSNWLNMMYPRLKLARNLMSEDALIFASIDRNEAFNLKRLLDEIFGEDNFVESYFWESTFRPDNSSKIFRKNAEFVLCYARNLKEVKQLVGHKSGSDGLPSLTKNSMNESVLKFPIDSVTTFLSDGTYIKGKRDSGYELLNDVNFVDGKNTNEFILKGRVIWGQEYLNRELENGTEIIIKSDGFVPYSKKNSVSLLAPNTLIPKELVSDVLSGRSEVTGIFNTAVFDYPKPVSLLKYLISFQEVNDSIVLDFFAGSGTTAHALMQLNSEDAGNRKFILVQLPEATEEKSDAYKAGYKTISEITKERIRRAGEKIKSEMKEDLFSEQGKTLDVGFRAFKLDSSNIRAWDGNPDALEDNLFNAGCSIKENRTEEDVLYEILLKYGLDLTMPIEQKAIADKQVFNIGVGALFICLGDNITTAVAEGIGKWKEELQPATSKVIFKDTGFTDVEKTNSMQILKRYGILEVNTI